MSTDLERHFKELVAKLKKGVPLTQADAEVLDGVSAALGQRISDRDIPLVTDAFTATSPAETRIRLCLDFGTAMSKAWATGNRATETIPLVLGAPAGLGNVLAVPSSVYISKTGRIYFGGAAETQHRQEMGSGRLRFDNLKRMLSDEDVRQELDDTAVSTAIDPTSTLSKGDILVLYLAWLTDLALTALMSQTSDGRLEISGHLRFVKRRFAIPCFEDAQDETRAIERAEWAQRIMERSILRAQLVADTLHEYWDQLTVSEARTVLMQVRNQDTAALSQLICLDHSVRESIAAGASRFEEEIEEGESGTSRRYMLVIDAGAGTTDFAVFEVFVDQEKERVRYGLIAPTVRMNRIAGNAIDEVLRPVILRACGIDPANGSPRSEGDWRLIRTDLDGRIRDLKQLLFENGEIDVALSLNTHGAVQLDRLEQEPAYRELGRKINETRQSILSSLFDTEFLELVRTRNEHTGQPMSISVLLTGGSSAVPIIRSLAEGELEIEGARFRFVHVKDLPNWIGTLSREEAELVGRNYRQCAVAIGGSVETLPKTVHDLRSAITSPRPGPRKLERNQTGGI